MTRQTWNNFKRRLGALHRDEQGADLVEYILVIAAIALPLLGVLIWFWNDIKEWATDAYDDTQYREARRLYEEAEGDLNVANTALTQFDLSASTVGQRTAELACACRTLMDTIDDLRGSAAAGVDNNGSRRRRLLNEAKAKLTGCGDVLDQLPVVEQVRNL